MFGLILTIVVMLAIATAILIFERPRARRIQQDLRDQAAEQRDQRPDQRPDERPGPQPGQEPGER